VTAANVLWLVWIVGAYAALYWGIPHLAHTAVDRWLTLLADLFPYGVAGYVVVAFIRHHLAVVRERDALRRQLGLPDPDDH
jgi:hypothetical protein